MILQSDVQLSLSAKLLMNGGPHLLPSLPQLRLLAGGRVGALQAGKNYLAREVFHPRPPPPPAGDSRRPAHRSAPLPPPHPDFGFIPLFAGDQTLLASSLVPLYFFHRWSSSNPSGSCIFLLSTPSSSINWCGSVNLLLSWRGENQWKFLIFHFPRKKAGHI